MRFGINDVTTDKATGRVVEGDPNKVEEATELWTFRRDQGGAVESLGDPAGLKRRTCMKRKRPVRTGRFFASDGAIIPLPAAPACEPSRTSSMIFVTKASRSPGLRLVMRP